MSITLGNIYSFIYFIIFFSIGFYIKIMPGLFIHDVVVIFTVIVLGFMKKLKYNQVIKELFILVSILIFIPIILVTFFKLFFAQYLFSINYIYYIYNFMLFFIYILFIYNTLPYIKFNFKTYIYFLSIPLLISILMFINYNFMEFIKNLYNLKQVYLWGRFGGIYGEYINPLGMHATVMLLLGLFLYKKHQISIWLFIYTFIISSIIFVISGMRSGFIAIIVANFILFLFYKKYTILNKYFYIILIIVLFLIVYFLFTFADDRFIELFMQRFSIHKLLADFGLAEADNMGSNIEVLHHMWENKISYMDNQEHYILYYLMGSDFNVTHDTPYIEYFFFHGLIGLAGFLILIFLIFIYIWKKTIRQIEKRAFLLYMWFIAVIFLFKANFPFANLYMFSMIILFFYFFDNRTLYVKNN